MSIDLVRCYSELVLAIRNDLGYKKARWDDHVKIQIGVGVLTDYVVMSREQREAEREAELRAVAEAEERELEAEQRRELP